jgi:phytoene desaturase
VTADTHDWTYGAKQPLAGESVTVVGGGIGGLASAAYLADAGGDVRLLEKNDRVGGAASLLDGEGFRFDTGPSWYLMPDVFERFFGHFDQRPGAYYDLERLDPHYRIFFKDGDRVDVPADPEGVRAIFESYEPGAGDAFDAYLAEARHTYEVGMEQFVYEDRSRLRDYLDLDVVRLGPGLTMLGSMQDHVESYVDHPKLQQLLQYTLVFLGGSPRNTPALYNLMAHVDFNLGVYYPRGGIYSVVEGLRDLATELGVTVETSAEVSRIRDMGDGLSAVTESEVHASDAVVANANPAHVERDLLAPEHRDYGSDYWDSRTYAPSAFMLYLGVEGDVDPLAHHTLVLPTDWDEHFRQIFEEPAWPDDPAYYVSVTSETDDTVAPDGHSAVVVLVPIATDLYDGTRVRQRYREHVLDDLAEHTGVELRDRIVFEASACLDDFAGRYNNPQGTALGLAHTLRQTGPLRPSHRSSSLNGLYYVGGFTSPGIGVPMTLISGQHAAESVVEDRTGSPLRWPSLPF